ncbi:hypothetical protein BURPS1106B_A1291 [Burkholderia pseudomallei 1106b]|nr:hypothetical protein BURPS1106B_A1291 [Burkholderia pseudomallei 1106b]
MLAICKPRRRLAASSHTLFILDRLQSGLPQISRPHQLS